MIKDVPVLIEHAVPLITPDGQPMTDTDGKRLHFPVSRKWMEAAVKRAYQKRKLDGYVPPLHINHHGMGRPVEAAGMLRLTRVVKGMYQGKPRYMLLADLEINRPEVYEEMKNGQLRYFSAEVLDFRKSPDVNSGALMRDTAPFFETAPVIPYDAENPWRQLPSATSKVGQYKSGRPYGAFAQLIDLTRPGTRLSADRQNYCGESGAMEGKPDMKELADAIGGAVMSALMQYEAAKNEESGMDYAEGEEMIDEIDETDDIVADDALSVPGKDEAPRPVELIEEDEEEESLEGMAKMQAQLGRALANIETLALENATLKGAHAKLQGKFVAREKSEKNEQAISAASKRLAPYGISRSAIEGAARHGGAALQQFVAGVVEVGQIDLTNFDGELPADLGTAESADLAFLHKLPVESHQIARSYAAEYRQFEAAGVRRSESMAQYVVRGMVGMKQLDPSFANIASAAPTNTDPLT